MSDEIDRTGFTSVKNRALRKAALIGKQISDESLIRQNAFAGQSSEKAGPSQPCLQRDQSVDAYDTSPRDRMQWMYEKKMMCELEKLSNQEAQAAKFDFILKLEEHRKKTNLMIMKEMALEDTKWLKMKRKVDEMVFEQLPTEEAKQFSNDCPDENTALKMIFEDTIDHMGEEPKVIETQPTVNDAGNNDSTNSKNDGAKTKYDALINLEIFCSNYEMFNSIYEELLELIESEKIKCFIDNKIPLIKGHHQHFMNLVNHAMNGMISSEDAVSSKKLVNQLEEISHECKEKCKTIENEIMTLEKERAQVLVDENTETSKLFEEYNSLKRNLENVELLLKNFVDDNSLKTFRSNCQKAVNMPVNAISPQSDSHMNDKLNRLLSLMFGQTVYVSDTRVNASQHPLGQLYCVYYLSKKVVKLGEQVVSGIPEAAYAISSVIVAIWTAMPEFGKLLLAQFHRSCPYLIPKYWDQLPNESEEQYYKKLGFLYVNNKVEDINLFLKRQEGIVRLFSAIVVSSNKLKNQSRPHPMPICNVWTWLVAFTSLKPKAFISATLLFCVLEVTAYFLLETYKNQFRKLLYFICKTYLPLVEKVTPEGSSGPVVRLIGFIEHLASGKSLQPPKGLLSHDFW